MYVLGPTHGNVPDAPALAGPDPGGFSRFPVQLGRLLSLDRHRPRGIPDRGRHYALFSGLEPAARTDLALRVSALWASGSDRRRFESRSVPPPAACFGGRNFCRKSRLGDAAPGGADPADRHRIPSLARFVRDHHSASGGVRSAGYSCGAHTGRPHQLGQPRRQQDGMADSADPAVSGPRWACRNRRCGKAAQISRRDFIPGKCRRQSCGHFS